MLLAGEFTKLADIIDMMPGLDGAFVADPTSNFRQMARNLSGHFGGPVGTPNLDAMGRVPGASIPPRPVGPGFTANSPRPAAKAGVGFLPMLASGIAGGMANDPGLEGEAGAEGHPLASVGVPLLQSFMPHILKAIPGLLGEGAVASGLGSTLAGLSGGPLAALSAALSAAAPAIGRAGGNLMGYFDQHPDFSVLDMGKDLKPTGFENYGPKALQHINQAATGGHLGKAMDWLGNATPEVGKSIDTGMANLDTGMKSNNLQTHGLLGPLWNKMLPSGMNQAMQGVNQMRSSDEGTGVLNTMLGNAPAAAGMNKDLMGPRMVANILGKAMK